MGGFFKMFFASLLALIIFSVIGFFVFLALIAGLTAEKKPLVEKNSVLVINTSEIILEQQVENPLSLISGDDDLSKPGLFDLVRLIKKAGSDENIKGIYLMTGINSNGFATSDEIRNALIDFKKSGKFIIAYGEVINQKSYHIANVANKIYVNPKGFIDWNGFSSNLFFLKGTLEKLDIQPQIFYAGKFKSATEPLRTDKMTDENKLQTSVWLNDLYGYFLSKTAEVRKVDTATLHGYANEGVIRTPQDAVAKKLVDGVKYDDEVRDEIKEELKLGKYDKVNFMSINSYFKAGSYKKTAGEKMALIYAQGDIVDGSSSDQAQIASAEYIKLIRKARLDKTIKAIVFRVNSGGGSALASEGIWRELSLAKEEKPVVVSFGDVAASGGYYISCAADSIFANPTTITGSIGVFGIIPNMQGFFKNKLGVTFDGVKTAPYADLGAIYRPMNESEKQIVQQSIDEIYLSFKQRVSDGRNKSIEYIDSIGQGRVWSGVHAIEIGLIDKYGGLQDAVDCAARLAKLQDYRLREYPEIRSVLDRILGKSDNTLKTQTLKNELGEEQYKVYKEMLRIKQITNTAQTRLPFEFIIN